MITRDITIINKLGLHARAAAKFVATASTFNSKLTVSKESRGVDGKSIMAVMLLAANQGSTLRLTCDGDDEEAAMAALTTLINNRFDESE
jgi:phosphocarrier protein HPr